MPLIAAALLVCLWPAISQGTGSREEEFPCVRFVQPAQRWVLRDGARQSPTLSRTAESLCRTDAIVYVLLDLRMKPGLAGSCGLVTATPVSRLLLVRLNARTQLVGNLIATLSHELDHALQIGRNAWVRDARDVQRLQQILSPGGGHAASADRAEAATRREIATGGLLRRADVRAGSQ
jgi:hypothetical protein